MSENQTDKPIRQGGREPEDITSERLEQASLAAIQTSRDINALLGEIGVDVGTTASADKAKSVVTLLTDLAAHEAAKAISDLQQNNYKWDTFDNKRVGDLLALANLNEALKKPQTSTNPDLTEPGIIILRNKLPTMGPIGSDRPQTADKVVSTVKSILSPSSS